MTDKTMFVGRCEQLTENKQAVGLSAVERVVKSPAPEILKEVATEFYYWWHNQPGTNTQQGFDSWWEINHKRFGF